MGQSCAFFNDKKIDFVPWADFSVMMILMIILITMQVMMIGR